MYKNLIELGIKIITTIATIILLLMMFLSVLDVALRYIFNRPIDGSLELVEYMMAILIPFSIAYCAFHKGHVEVKLITEHFSNKTQASFRIITSFFTAIFLIIITWKNIAYFFETYASNISSAVLLIPRYPFIIPTIIGIGIFAMIAMRQLGKVILEVKNK